MSKNAYEIRLELLKMAQDICSRELDIQNDAMWQAIDNAVSPDGKAQAAKDNRPKMYTIEDVTKKAGELQKFVNK